MQNVTRRDADTVGALSSPGAGQAAADESRVVSEAVGLLRGGTLGVLLAGPRGQALIPRIMDGLRPLPFAPIRFDAVDGTIERLRAAVERVHARRPDPSVALLLVVDDADRLTAELLQELELAAAAADDLGGLKFLFVARHELAAGLRQRGLPALAACLQTSLGCAEPPQIRDAGDPVRMAPPVRRDAPPARLFPILAAGGTLALLGVVLTVGIVGLRRPAMSPEPRAPQVASLATPPPPRAVVAPPPASSPPSVVLEAPQPPTNATVTAPAPAPALPAASLLLIAGPGDTLRSLYMEVYRGTTPPPLAQVAGLNPPVVTIGTRLVFPAPAAGWSHTR